MIRRHGAEAARVRHALALRTAVLGLFADGDPTVDERDAMQHAPEDAWHILLTCECCALPLAARLHAHRLFDTLPATTQRRISAAALAELQRVLAARSTLGALDLACATLDITPIVLKGGAIAGQHRNPPLDLGDVDALVGERDAARLWAHLRTLGWRRRSGDPMPPTPTHVDANHVEGLLPAAEGLPLELHTRLDYHPRPTEDVLSQTRPLEGHRMLRRLVGADAFVAALRHSVVKHPHRRGHLRDLVLLASALSECGEGFGRIDELLAADPMAPELMAMCAQARAMAEGRPIVDDPPTRRYVTWKYVTFVQPVGLLGRLPGWAGLNYLPLEREETRRAELGRQLRYALGPVPATSPFATFGQRGVDPTDDAGTARVRRGASRAMRALYRIGLLTLLVLTSRSTRRRIDFMSRS